MPYTVALPDGRTVEFPDSVSREDAAAIIRRQFGGGPQPESGFGAALRSGIQGLFGAGAALAGRTGVMDMEEAQRAVDARRKRQEEIFKPTEEWGITKLTELLGGSIPYMAAPLAAAGAAAALPVTGPAAVAAGLGAAGLASATQFTGTNLSRQIEEGKKLAETDLGNAALAAVPMALLDTLALRMLPGVGKLLGDAGIKVTKETAKDVSEQILKKAAMDYTAATGRAMAAEGLTEAAQQGFERLQAGLNIADADARKEYFDALVGGALLGGAIAPVGRSMERGKAKREIAAIEQEEADKQAAAAREAETKRKQDPAYLEGLNTTYQELLAQKNALTQQLKKGTKEAPLSQEDRDANAVINEQLSALKQPFERARKEFISAGGPQALAKLREGRLELTPQPSEPVESDETLRARLDAARQQNNQPIIDVLQRRMEERGLAEAPEAPEAQRARLTQDVAKLTALLDQQREAILKAATPEEALQVAQRAQQTYEALTAANTELGKLPTVPTQEALKKQEAELLKKFEAARDKGDQQAVLDIVPKLQAVRKQLAEAAPFDLTSEEYAAEEDRKRAALGQAMGEGRETALDNRRQTDIEQQFAREQAAKSAALQAQLDFEGQAEREALTELAASRAADMRARELQPLRTAPQLALFPEAQGRVARAEMPLTPRERPPEMLPLRAELAWLLAEKRKLKQPRVEVDDGRVAEIDARVAEIDARIAELEATSRTAPGSPSELVPLRPELSRLLAEKRALEQERATPRGEPVNDRIREIDTRVAEIEEQLTGLTQRAVETRSVMAPPDTPQADRRPQGPLPERLNALAERVLASPQVDEETKDLVRQVQDNLPALMPRTDVGAWLYRTLQGTAPPDLTQDIRNKLAELEAGRRSETESTPTGETRRAVQSEIEMPEPKAVAFATPEAFADYLASDGLAAYRNAAGIVGPTVSRLEQFFAPMRAKAAALMADKQRLETLRTSLKARSSGQQQAAAQRVREAEQRVAVARAELEPLVWKYLAMRDLAQQRYSDALTQGLNLALQLRDAVTQFKALSEAQLSLMPDAPRPAPRPVGLAVDATNKVRAAQQALEKQLDVWMDAETAKRDFVQANVGKEWTDSVLRSYDALKKTTDIARKDLDFARKRFESAKSGVKALQTIPDSVYNQLIEKDEELQGALQQQMRRINGFYTNLKKVKSRFPELDALVDTRDKEAAAVYKSAKNYQPAGSGDLTAAFAQSRERMQQAITEASDAIGYVGTPEQQNALEAAQKNLEVALELQQQVVEELRVVDTQASGAESLAKAKASAAAAIENRIAAGLQAARTRAKDAAQTRAPKSKPGETQGQREARSGQERAAEQARLERAETPVAGPETPLAGVYAEKPIGVRQKEGEPVQSTRITYAREDKQDFKRALAAFEERFMLATTKDEIAAVKADIDTYLASYAASQDAKIDEAKRKAANNLKDLSAQRKKVAELTERLKGDLTPKRRATAEKQLKEAQEKVQEHQRRYAINASEIKLVRTDIQAARKARNDALAEANRNVVAGERLGVAEGTRKRAIGPVTRPEVYPPNTMRTGSEESRAGETTANKRSTLQEVRGVQQRDVPMKSAEQAEANKIAEALRKKTPEQQAKEKKEEAAVQKEQAALQAQPTKVKPIEVTGEFSAKNVPVQSEAQKAPATPAAAPAAPTGEKKPKAPRRKVQELFEDDTDLDTFKPEILGGPREKVFYSRGATADPSTTASVRAELGTVFPDIGRVQIYDSVDALVKANPQYEGRIPDDARGFVDTAGNKAFLIAENIDKGDALAVLLHEVGAHIGLKNMLGEAQYNALVKAVETWAKRNDGSIESRVAKAALERVEDAKTPANQKADETLAYAIEEAVKAGIKPMETKGALGQWLSQISALFRKALEKFGMAPEKLDAQGLVDMAFGAAKLVMQPAVPQMSRRQFLRGAGAALGAMKLPPLSKNMREEALIAAWDASMDAGRTWFDVAKATSKTNEVNQLVKQYALNPNKESWATTLANISEDLYHAVHEYDFGSDGDPYWYLEKNGVKAVAELQQALQAQRTALLDAVKNYGKERGALPEVGELFFTGAGAEKKSAFKRWFGNSKVVDAEGKPLVVYHGTGSDITKFGAKNVLDLGHWFTDNADSAAFFAEFKETPTIIPVYLSLQNPFKLHYTNELGRSGHAIAHVAKVLGVRARRFDRDFNYKLKQALIAQGYDGVAITYEGSEQTHYVALKGTQIKSAIGNRGTYDQTNRILFSRNLPTASRVADSLIAKEQSWLDKIKTNLRAGRAQYVDKLAPVEEALKGGKVDDFKATQALYNLRMYDQRMHFTAQAFSDGAPGLVEKTRKDGRTERLVESVPGANIKQIVDILKAKDVVREAGSPDAANKLFTLYLAAIRGERVGYDALNFKVKTDDIKAARAEIEANPTLKTAFDKAREVYNNYNRNLIQFAIDTGAIGKEHGRQLLQSNDYIPYYRVRDGVAKLMIGKETPVRIGNLKDSPHLQELVGGDEAIFDFLTSSVQNTSMLLDMSMRNLAVKNLMFEFRDVGLAKIGKAKGGKTPEGAVTFKKDGKDYFAVVDTDAIGVDSELLVKGLAGIPTMFPTIIQVLGVPARLLRRLVVASPVYMARQLVRDSTSAAIASGADIAPVLSSLKQIGKPSVLERRGITGGMVFTGMPEDQTRLLKEMQAGKISLSSGLARMEALSAKVDALTREAQYASYREQGMSEMEATLMALESMNFSRRGLSPTMHMLGTLLPFFNAQIQGLDVLYRSFRGQMPFNERLQVREKLFKRGMMLFGMSMLYATLMQDDEAYQNAKVEEKYGNFFVPVPGTDQMMRVPIPFELGYIFKALPEALVNMLANEGGGEEALKALEHIAKQTVPGLSSYFLPQAIKPALEVALDHSIFTGRGLESSREAQVEPGFRYRDNTTELAKMVGEATGFSPIKMEYLIRGYTGSLGMAAMAALSAPFGSSGPESAAKRPSDMPVVGTLFQPTDASGIVDLVYEKMNKAKQVQQTYKSLIEKGRPEDAQKYLDENVDNMMLSSMAGQFTQQMGELTKYERSIRGSDMTPEEKRAALDEIRQAKIALAKAVRDQLGKTTRQAVPA